MIIGRWGGGNILIMMGHLLLYSDTVKHGTPSFFKKRIDR